MYPSQHLSMRVAKLLQLVATTTQRETTAHSRRPRCSPGAQEIYKSEHSALWPRTHSSVVVSFAKPTTLHHFGRTHYSPHAKQLERDRSDPMQEGLEVISTQQMKHVTPVETVQQGKQQGCSKSSSHHWWETEKTQYKGGCFLPSRPPARKQKRATSSSKSDERSRVRFQWERDARCQKDARNLGTRMEKTPEGHAHAYGEVMRQACDAVVKRRSEGKGTLQTTHGTSWCRFYPDGSCQHPDAKKVCRTFPECKPR